MIFRISVYICVLEWIVNNILSKEEIVFHLAAQYHSHILSCIIPRKIHHTMRCWFFSTFIRPTLTYVRVPAKKQVRLISCFILSSRFHKLTERWGKKVLWFVSKYTSGIYLNKYLLAVVLEWLYFCFKKKRRQMWRKKIFWAAGRLQKVFIYLCTQYVFFAAHFKVWLRRQTNVWVCIFQKCVLFTIFYLLLLLEICDAINSAINQYSGHILLLSIDLFWWEISFFCEMATTILIIWYYLKDPGGIERERHNEKPIDRDRDREESIQRCLDKTSHQQLLNSLHVEAIKIYYERTMRKKKTWHSTSCTSHTTRRIWI